MKVGIVGAGWAGLAAAVQATLAGHTVTVFEAARAPGGRGRTVVHTAPDGTAHTLDNGQHILIGAYGETLRLMRAVGVAPQDVLLRLPLDLRFADGTGLALPDWPAPWDALAGIVGARGWSWRDKAALLRTAAGWRLNGFRCAPAQTVSGLCVDLTPRVHNELIEPLCVSALNTPAARSSGQVFLRVMQDSLLGARGASNLLIPRRPLGALFPEPAIAWLGARGQSVQLGHRVAALQPGGDAADGDWLLDGIAFDRVLLACPSWEASRLLRGAGAAAHAWVQQAEALQFEAITTVYAHSAVVLDRPMTALRSGPGAPAQVVFDRRRLQSGAGMDPADDGLLAFVASVSEGSRERLEQQVIDQGRAQLALGDLAPVFTITEKRATFACTPGLARPPMQVAPRLLACGEYVAGPYPGTLEGAVRSGVAAAGAL